MPFPVPSPARARALFAAALAVLPFGATAPAADLPVVFRTSKVHGLVNFVETLAGEAHRSRSLKAAFEQSPYNDAAAKRYIAMYQDLAPILHASADFPGYTSSRARGLQTGKVLLTISAYAPNDDLTAYLAQSGAILPPDVNARYAEVLHGLAPVYDALVWTDGEKPLAKLRAELEKRAKAWGMATILAQAAKFYGAAWPAGQAFTVVLYPMPGKKGHSSAESLGSFESVGVFVDADPSSLADRFGVMVHEICHSLYAAEPHALQQDIDDFFAADPRPHALHAGRWLNEGLATALGNGWAAEVALGKPDPAAWYDDRYVDGYAHALYPLVRDYVDRGKTIDHAFLDAAVAAFAAAFPEAPHEVTGLMAEMIVVAPGRAIASAAIGKALRDTFRVPSMTRLGGAVDREAVDVVTRERSTVVIAATADELDGLAALNAPLPRLPAAVAALKAKSGDALYGAFDANSRALFVLKAKDAEAVERGVKKLAALKTLPASGALVDF